MPDPSNVATFRVTPGIAEQRIRDIAAASANVALTVHAKDRMRERDITDTDVYRILRRGSVDSPPQLTDKGEWKCKITLPLSGRRTAGVVVAMQWPAAKLIVITVEWEDGK